MRASSDPTAVKPMNKAERSVAELVEPRTGTKGNAGQQSTRRAQDRESVSQALEHVRQAARQRKKERFTSLLHHVDPAMLRTASYVMKRDAAPGVDGMTWETYERDLDRKIEDLHARVKSGAYRALPSRRGNRNRTRPKAGSCYKHDTRHKAHEVVCRPNNARRSTGYKMGALALRESVPPNPRFVDEVLGLLPKGTAPRNSLHLMPESKLPFRIGIVADVHQNTVFLKHVLDFFRTGEVEMIFSLGDYSFTRQPDTKGIRAQQVGKVMQQLASWLEEKQSHRAVVLLGNHKWRIGILGTRQACWQSGERRSGGRR